MKAITRALPAILAALMPIGSAHADDALLAKRIAAPRLDLNPLAAQWRQAKPYRVEIMAQTITNPQNPKPATEALTVRALHNGAEIAFLLEWQDAARDEIPRTGYFTDAVALELPLKPDGAVSPMMGQKGHEGRVNILQWRADWQAQVKTGEVKVRDLYPNMVNDAETMAVYKGQDQEIYSPAKVVGNMMAQGKPSSVMDLMAEGFGSLTPKRVQAASGMGVWNKGKWQVVICRPFANQADADLAPLHPGKTSNIAFAVWNGGKGERGSRKGWAPWLPLQIER
jgi:DMSO reductase family type II enzyme heme b subunit